MSYLLSLSIYEVIIPDLVVICVKLIFVSDAIHNGIGIEDIFGYCVGNDMGFMFGLYVVHIIMWFIEYVIFTYVVFSCVKLYVFTESDLPAHAFAFALGFEYGNNKLFCDGWFLNMDVNRYDTLDWLIDGIKYECNVFSIAISILLVADKLLNDDFMRYIKLSFVPFLFETLHNMWYTSIWYSWSIH